MKRFTAKTVRKLIRTVSLNPIFSVAFGQFSDAYLPIGNFYGRYVEGNNVFGAISYVQLDGAAVENVVLEKGAESCEHDVVYGCVNDCLC